MLHFSCALSLLQNIVHGDNPNGVPSTNEHLIRILYCLNYHRNRDLLQNIKRPLISSNRYITT